MPPSAKSCPEGGRDGDLNCDGLKTKSQHPNFNNMKLGAETVSARHLAWMQQPPTTPGCNIPWDPGPIAIWG